MRIRGRVYEELSERGLSGILVSNGEDIVQTDVEGWYTLQVDTEAHRFVFITVPDRFETCEEFFQPTRPWTDSRENVHFRLRPDPHRAILPFSVAQITDTHVVTADSREILIQDLRQLVQESSPNFIIATGDLTNRGKLEELGNYREAIQNIGTPVFSLFGGHDGNEERSAGESGNSFTRNYEQILGPTYYSFDWGSCHFVLHPTEDHFFSSSDRKRKEQWFWSDLALQQEKREIVIAVHTPPRTVFLEQLSQYNVRLLLYGHWHSSKVYSQGKIMVAATPSLCFGGIDTTPRSYRLVEFREEEVHTELMPLQQAGAYSPSEEASSEIPPGSINDVAELRWEHQLPMGCHRASPVCTGDQLLLSLQDAAYPGRDGIHCLHAQTGEFRWHVPTDAAARNSIAVTTRDRCAAVSITGRVSVIEVTSGHLLWQADLPGYPERWIYTSPAIADDTLYAGAKAGYAAYDLETGREQWYTNIESNDAWSCYASPQIYEDLLIVLVQRRGLLGLNRRDGSIVWEQKLAVEYQYPSPAIFDDLLISSGDASSLAVLQAQSGEIIWHEPVLSTRYVSGLTVHGKRIYVTTPDGEAQCYDLHSGELYWRFKTGEDLLDMTPYRRGIRSILAAPVIFRDHLLIGGCDGVLYALDAELGECQSRIFLGSPITASPCVVENGFYVGTYAGKVCHFGS